MSRSLRVTAGMIGALTFGLVRASAAGPEPQSPASSLRVVVVAGEGAINILEQKSAVAPVVEVRDRNDQPIAGALVTFTVRRGGAAFNGARTISVTTDA